MAPQEQEPSGEQNSELQVTEGGKQPVPQESLGDWDGDEYRNQMARRRARALIRGKLQGGKGTPLLLKQALATLE
ncbi:MAG: hypothetical protein GF390_01825, partial [Candidatus Pacebacteria bacterium]|nr:hypothetical protein [Candidatus Paceibacterota bacterium]